MTNVQNYRPLSCPFLLPMLLGAIFQQLQAYMGVHSGRERPKNFFPYYRKNNALKFKNKEKKEPKQLKTKQGLVIPEYSFLWYFVLQLFTYPR